MNAQWYQSIYIDHLPNMVDQLPHITRMHVITI